MPCTCARCCPTCTLRTPPARPSTPPCGTLSEATSHRPARTHRPALAPGTRARGRHYPSTRPRPQPPSRLPASRRSHGPQGAPDRHADTLARAPPAAWPARRALPRHALRPHGVGLLGPLPTASWAARASQQPPRAPHPHGAASASAARRYPCARPRPQPPGNATCSLQVPRPAEGPAPGTPAPLRTRPPQLGLQDAPSPGTPTDPTMWGAQGHCRPPAGPPAPPRNSNGPCTRMAPRPPRPPAATHAPSPGLDPQATQPAHCRSLGPQRGPHPARRRPCARALRSLDCRTRPPPTRPPTPLCGALRATADRRLDRPQPPATATGPAPAWRRVRLGRPPLPMRPARASTPRRLCRAASRKQDTGTGTRGQHLNRTRHASNCIPMIVLLCSRPCALPPP